jgi:hypothetical protein
MIIGISIFIMTLLVTSCSGEVSAVLQDDTCKAPCWRNIEMGKTGIEQTIELLNQMPDIDPNSIRQGKNPQTGVEGISAGFLSDDSNLEIRILNDELVSIYFSFEKNISLADAIKKFGAPTFIYPTAISGDPFAYLTVDFWYPELGVCLHHANKKLVVTIPRKYRINGGTNITQIYYVDPTLPQGQLTYGCLFGGNENEMDSIRQEWKGYAEYPIP